MINVMHNNWESLYAGLGFILDATLKGSLILLIAGALTIAARGLSAAARHWLWSLALSSFVALPLMSSALPAIRLPVLPDDSLFQRESLLTAQRETIRPVSAMQPVETSEKEQQNAGGLTESSIHEQMDATKASIGEHKDRAASTQSFFSLASLPWFVWALLIWAAGASFVLSRLLFEIIIILRLTRRGKIVNNREWTHELELCKERLSMNRPLRLVESNRVSMPMTWGFLSPVVLIPAKSTEWSEERRR